ncbi:MAG TPA: TrkA C-terminal domain-containing protein, partial [Bryobacteraceae bacterium]|nr:TrkA C-terminal domain-containing protein [Bryobacteraceae bacterium]
ILARDFLVSNPGIAGHKIGEVLRLHPALGFVVSRVRRQGRTSIATPEAELALGDIVVAVGDEQALERAGLIFGEPAQTRIELDRNEVDYRRMFVSNPELAGRRIADLDLYDRHSAVITRVRRGDQELVPKPETRLEYGDLVRVLTYRSNFQAVSAYLGDSVRGTAETDFGSAALGMALGVIAGMIPIPLPGTTVRLGLAGGPLLVALMLGRLERTGPISWSMPLSANLTLRQIGLILFQAGVGTRAGLGFVETIRTSGFTLLATGAAITLAVAVVSVIVGYKLLKIPFDSVMGLTCAIHTEPASLNYAAHAAGSDVPQSSYARIFPVCTVVKIILAQLLVTFPGGH